MDRSNQTGLNEQQKWKSASIQYLKQIKNNLMPLPAFSLRKTSSSASTPRGQ